MRVTAYSHLRTGKGRLKGWRERRGKQEFGDCSCWAGITETGTHTTFECIKGEK